VEVNGGCVVLLEKCKHLPGTKGSGGNNWYLPMGKQTNPVSVQLISLEEGRTTDNARKTLLECWCGFNQEMSGQRTTEQHRCVRETSS
jgi:hypothetical protein